MNAARRFFAPLLLLAIAVSISPAAAPRIGDDPREAYERGVKELKTGKFDAAIETFTTCLEIDLDRRGHLLLPRDRLSPERRIRQAPLKGPG